MVDFFGNGTIFQCMLAIDELNRLSAFHRQTETFWLEQEVNLEEELKEKLNSAPTEEHEKVIHDHVWYAYQTLTSCPDYHRESLLITLFNFLEHQLNGLCEKLSEGVDSHESKSFTRL